MMAGKGKLTKAKPKDKSLRREGLLPSVPVLAPFDEFKASPVRPTRRSAGTDLLSGLPDKVTRTKKSPLPKDPETKEGTVEVPGLSSLLGTIDKVADERHQSSHANVPPPKEHRELPSEEKQDKSIESSSNQTGVKGLDAEDASIVSSSNQTGDKGLNRVDSSIGSSSSHEGDKSPQDKEAEEWLANTKSMFDERTNGTKKWGDDLSDDEGNDKSDKGSNATKVNNGRDSDGSTTDEKDDDPQEGKDNLGSTPPSIISPEDEKESRVFTFAFIDNSRKPWSEQSVGHEASKSPNSTQVQESSSAAAPLVNRSEGTAEDKAKWISFLNSPRNSHPNSPSGKVMSRSPRYDPLPLEGSAKSDEEDETKDQDMVDLTKGGALSSTEEVSMSIEEPADPYTQEEAEEHFIQALVERSQNGELNTVDEVIQAILDIGGEAISDEGLPITFTARIALKLLP